MKALTRLLRALEYCHDTQSRVATLRDAFNATSPYDMPWLLAVLLGQQTRKIVNSVTLRAWAINFSNIPAWLYEESLLAVGDVSETIALMVQGDGTYAEESLHALMLDLDALSSTTRDEQQLWVLSHWSAMSSDDRFVLNKLLTGTFRLGVQKGLVLRALSEATGLDVASLAHRLLREWTPKTLRYADLIAPDDVLRIEVRPYGYCLPFPLDVAPSTLGDLSSWQAEWKWDGIRAQVIVRNGELYVWTRDEELVTDKFPELHALIDSLQADVVLDGEILAFSDSMPLPVADVRRRLARKSVNASTVRAAPMVFMAFDVLEYDGIDVRSKPLAVRRTLLESIMPQPATMLSPVIQAPTWTELGQLRSRALARHTEGLVLKRRDSVYSSERTRGDWWTWKTDPHKVIAILVYAQSESTARDAAFIEYTFAVWKEGALVPIAKTIDGISPEDAMVVDAFIRSNTVEKFGPVRTVKPELVFEIAFESIQRSTRHKSGVSVRVPRIVARRPDVDVEQADTIESVLALLP